MEAKMNEVTSFRPEVHYSLGADDPYVSPGRNSGLRLCSELLCNMLERNATGNEISDVVKYSMVLIDADKKKLDWKQACIDFKIMDLACKYLDTPRTFDEFKESVIFCLDAAKAEEEEAPEIAIALLKDAMHFIGEKLFQLRNKSIKPVVSKRDENGKPIAGRFPFGS